MPPPNPQAPPPSTRLESADEIRQALDARRLMLKGQKAGQPAAPAASPALSEARTERPTERAPMALLCILDDGRQDGEWVRIRTDRFVLGRVEGDVIIPHDGMMSGRHAEIVRQKTQSGYRWTLNDLGSTNGTWVRARETLLSHMSEFMVGRTIFRFEGAGQTIAEDLSPSSVPQGTRAWASGVVPAINPSVVEVTPNGLGTRTILRDPEYWIGRDPSCGIVRPDDPFMNARHARLHRDARGQYHVENQKSLNGIWLRVPDIALTGACQFRLGEQRFLFRAL